MHKREKFGARSKCLAGPESRAESSEKEILNGFDLLDEKLLGKGIVSFSFPGYFQAQKTNPIHRLRLFITLSCVLMSQVLAKDGLRACK